MPIKALATTERAFPVCGTLRKGGPKEQKTVIRNGKEVTIDVVGRDLDHFRFVTLDNAAARKWAEVYPGQTRSVRVLLPHPTVEQSLTAWREEWRGGGLIHRCDGETMVIWRAANGVDYESGEDLGHRPCPHAGILPARERACKPVGRLTVMIREFTRLAHVIALTTSVVDIIELTRNLNAAFAIRGNLCGIPFLLTRVEREISTPDPKAGGRRRMKKWLLHIEPDPVWVERLIERQIRDATPELTEGERRALEGVITTTARPLQLAAPAVIPSPPASPAAPKTVTDPVATETVSGKDGRAYSRGDLLDMFRKLRNEAASDGYGMTAVGDLDAALPLDALVACIRALRDRMAAVKSGGGGIERTAEIIFPTAADLAGTGSRAEDLAPSEDSVIEGDEDDVDDDAPEPAF